VGDPPVLRCAVALVRLLVNALAITTSGRCAMIGSGSRPMVGNFAASAATFEFSAIFVNAPTATTRLATQDLIRFIEACGHEPLIIPLG